VASFDEAVPPGQVGKINATLRTAGYRGQVIKTIAVTTNDPAHASAMLSLKARIIGSVELLPNPSLSVTSAGPESRPGRVIVRKDATETGTLAVSNLAVSLPWLQVTSRRVEGTEPQIEGLPETRPGDTVVEVVAKAETPPPGSFSGSVTFKTGLSREPEVMIPVYGFVRAPIVVSPTELTLRPGVEGMMIAVVRGDVDIEQLTASAEPATIKLSREWTNARTLKIRLTLDEAAGPATTTGKITIRSGAASATVPVRVER
jgi:hypothetical protein